MLFQQFLQDKTTQQLLDSLMSHYRSYSEKLTGVKPPRRSLKVSYKDLCDQYSRQRGTPLWYPYLGSGLGSGPLVELADGSVKYDLICGIGPHFSHGDPGIVRAQLEASFQDVVMQGNLQQNVDITGLVDRFVTLSGLDHCFLTTSGAMAAENALKLAFAQHQPATRVLAFEDCFMGRTLGLSSLTDKPQYRNGLPETLSVDYIPFYDAASPKKSTERAVSALTRLLARYPGQYAAMVFELVQGEGGFKVGHTDFFKALMSVLKSHSIAVIVDEIQTFGRTPALFAFQYFKLDKYVDIVTVGKLTQVCATLYRSDYKPPPGLISQTFSGATSAIAASRVILDRLSSGAYYGSKGSNSKMQDYFTRHFKRLSKTYPIQGPFGVGAMIAVTVFDGDKARTLSFLKVLFDRGLIAFVAGSDPCRIRFLLPIGGFERVHVDEIMAVFESALSAFLTEKEAT